VARATIYRALDDGVCSLAVTRDGILRHAHPRDFGQALWLAALMRVLIAAAKPISKGRAIDVIRADEEASARRQPAPVF
jgi:hypothetical protein